jgi:hypothetical protein
LLAPLAGRWGVAVFVGADYELSLEGSRDDGPGGLLDLGEVLGTFE